MARIERMDNYGPCEMCPKQFVRLTKADGLKVCKECEEKITKEIKPYG